MIVKNKMTPVDRAFWAHCEAVAREVGLWPGWMRGEPAVPPMRHWDWCQTNAGRGCTCDKK
jgi:hypothetical protein